ISHQQHAAMLARLQQADPGLHEAAFNARVTTAFHKIQSAWSAHDMRPVRAFVSDAVFERFSLQFDEQRALGHRNVTEDVRVDDVRLVHVDADRFFDTVSLRIEAWAKDHDVRLSDGARVGGSDHSGPFVEIWSFLRRRGTKTDPSKPGLIEGNCPNCGGGIEMNQNASCAHCGALLRSGEYDWVLAEITQECEWSPEGGAHAVRGAREMILRDPGFNVQDLEDRTSVMFWRRAAAERTGNVKPLRKIAESDFADAMESALSAEAKAGPRRYYGECAVGSVQTMGVIVGDEWDRALVEVRWSGSEFLALSKQPPNQPARKTGQTTLTRTAFELSRRAGVKSDVTQAISSAHCPGCGAPERGGTSAACEHCGVTLNDGRHGWVLTAVRSVQEAREMLSSIASEAGMEASTDGDGDDAIDADGSHADAPSTAGVLAWMASMAAADRHVDAKEMQLLSRVAAKRKVPQSRVDALLAAAGRSELDLPTPQDAQQSKQWLTAMASAALVDGNLSRDEYNLLLHTGGRMGMGEYDVKMLLRKTRSDALARAKEALRAKRNGH
ncbi:MAG: TIM44-like domain-containing protein, partial [Tepidisphaeraceae bacterium]